jgi:hypothetical protein
MSTQENIEAVSKSDILNLGVESWNSPRSTEQLLGFIARREAEVFATES